MVKGQELLALTRMTRKQFRREDAEDEYKILRTPYGAAIAQRTHDTPRIICSREEDCAKLDIKSPLFVCAPMVRYSKLPFRKLVSNYGCDLAYTPMIFAQCFLNSEKCRDVEFSTDEEDRPIVQFASNKPVEFAGAAALVYGQVRGIDLNCGCPKHEVRKGGYGSKMLDEPELIADIYPISKSVDLCQKLEHAGISHIAVHGRTKDMRGEKPDIGAIATIKAAVKIPVYANGDCKSYEEALEMTRITKADGIMVANGLLANPALFGGHPKTPWRCFDLNDSLEMTFDNFHHHLMFMLRAVLPKQQRIAFNELRSDGKIGEEDKGEKKGMLVFFLVISHPSYCFCYLFIMTVCSGVQTRRDELQLRLSQVTPAFIFLNLYNFLSH
uniref:DUS-like FMN-binding domain-containing protein n=1 Tax=Ditylenchus dipsaci TaxID=166011 RepID=A0A915E8W2_9BILA